ncbi:MFS general substrate transporter [Auriculariales sp. MPI-PUGE-AT-0066]|nr:MFS general substrate transporter [Auriculariales sp. MPI-PUGE-AT-0066]
MADMSAAAAVGPTKLTPEQRRAMSASEVEEYESQGLLPSSADERTPLLSSGASAGSSEDESTDSHEPVAFWTRFRRASPFWYVLRGMTIGPRVEVYTQLACHNLVPIHHTDSPQSHLEILALSSSLVSEPFVPIQLPSLPVGNATDGRSGGDDDDEPITTIPSKECLTNPQVSAATTRIQFLMTIIMGVLSSITTGYWGQFGDRFGRRPVMIVSAFGLMFVDAVFILVSQPHSKFSGHGHKFLLVAPFVEGLLGGWSTFIAATNAYISDCTDHGSRAKIFSRISGITYVGFALGPIMGNAWIALHPAKTTDSAFQLAVMLGVLNLILLVTLIPESVTQETRQTNKAARETEQSVGPVKTFQRSIGSFFAPLELFMPKTRGGEVSWSDYKDWNMTCLAIAMFCYLLTVALFQLKYVYATKVYAWAASELSYYISIMGAVRAIHLLFILPVVIRMFRKKSRRNVTLKQRTVYEAHAQDVTDMEAAAQSREIHFDLLVVKLSLVFDMASHLMVTFLHPNNGLMFTAITIPSSMAAGMLPAVQSLALCILRASGETAEIGKLFGAISVLQATASTIVGPALFALVFQRTVGKWNEAIFALAASLIFVALCMYVIEGTLASVRAHRRHWLREEEDPEQTVTSPTAMAGPGPSSAAHAKRLLAVPVPGQSGKRRRDRERGRSRRSKDLSTSGGGSEVSDSDPSRSLPQAFHKYKMQLQHQDSAAV